MKDDLLIRFIDGKTTPEETEQVFKELSQDGDAAKEWLQMVQGARLADTKPVVNLEPDDFISRTLADKSQVQPRQRKLIRLPWILTGITAVAASVAVIATVFVNNDDKEILQNVIAEVPDTADVILDIDSASVGDNLDIKEVSQQALADVGEQNGDERVSPHTEELSVEQTPSVEQSEELVGRRILQDTNTATASKSESSSFEMIRPAKSPYRIRVRNPEKEFVFEWKMTNASDVRLSIADNEGKIIIDNEWIMETSYGVIASDLVDKGELDWTVEVTFNDGSMQRKTGKIELVSVKE